PKENGEFSKAVARGFSRLMAYKDEYEVARLYTNGDFINKLNSQFDGDIQVKFNLAPPLFSKRDPVTGHLKKKEYGSWMMKAFALLAKFKGLRGTRFDIFGYSEERNMERELINEYEQLILALLPKLTSAAFSSEQYQTAVELASSAQKLRGYGHVKENNVAQVKQQWKTLQRQINNPVKVIYKQAI
ncbi:MAG: DUF6537 domain-containing protein, partial [Cognaticolwellia sp.]